MGHWIDEDTYQYDDEREMMAALGLDPDTIHGDYAEAYQHIMQSWKEAKIDTEFNKKFFGNNYTT